ncbi:hypothetical protein LPJ60_004046 [Coemansia sp. RSA 2675]|nr:hypothetical protein LPJ60_004046 [Coemansia sp. RSA 2675]
MARGSGQRRPRPRPSKRAQENSQAGTPARPVQEPAEGEAEGPSTSSTVEDSSTVVRELADTLYIDIGQILQREYGKTNEQILRLATHSDESANASDQAPAPLGKDATPAEHTLEVVSDSQSTCESLKEENRRLLARLAEREAENEALQRQVAAQQQEIEAARRRAARLDARTDGEARTDMNRPMTLPELRSVFRKFYEQYRLREAHFMAVERVASLEAQLWQEKCVLAEKRESTHLDEIRDLRQNIESLAQQRPASGSGGEELRQRLEQCRRLVRAVSGEAAALRADCMGKMQSMDQHVRHMSRERVEMDVRLRSALADNERLEEACKELQVRWQQQAWELHNKRMLDDRKSGAADSETSDEGGHHPAATLDGAVSAAQVQNPMSPPRVIRMPRRPRPNDTRREPAPPATATIASHNSNGVKPLIVPDQRDPVGASPARPRFHAPAGFTFRMPLSTEIIQSGVSAV